MKILILFCGFLSTTSILCGAVEERIHVPVGGGMGETPPTWANITGISGEALQVLQFDLYVQGFNFTNAESAQYLISGKNNGNFEGRAMDRFNKNNIVSKAYSGA